MHDMKHKVSTLSGALLDRAVALALGAELRMSRPWEHHDDEPAVRLLALIDGVPVSKEPWAPSTTWSQAGPIMQAEGISPERCKPDSMDAGDPLVSDGRWMWVTEEDGGCGPTMLVSAMRTFVIRKLGPVVDLP